MNQEKQRWKYRFDNFKRAYFLLQEAVAKNSDVKKNNVMVALIISEAYFLLQMD